MSSSKPSDISRAQCFVTERSARPCFQSAYNMQQTIVMSVASMGSRAMRCIASAMEPAARRSSADICPYVPAQTIIMSLPSSTAFLATAVRFIMPPISTSFAADMPCMAAVPLVVLIITLRSHTASLVNSYGLLPRSKSGSFTASRSPASTTSCAPSLLASIAASPGSIAGTTLVAPFPTAVIMQLVERKTSTTITVQDDIWLLKTFPYTGITSIFIKTPPG